MKSVSNVLQNRRLKFIVLTATLLLFTPLVAMQFTDEVKWTRLDFIVAGVLLFGTGLLCEIAMRMIKKVGYRVAICSVILLAFVLVWVELAVGIFGTRFAGS